jgi:glucokinase
LAEATYPSADYPSLESVAIEFLSRVDLPVREASFGVAGPVIAGRSESTNLSWTMDEEEIRRTLGLSSVRLLNDLAAIAWAIPHLEPGDVHTLNKGRPAPGGAIAVVAPGTGLGEAFLIWDGSRYSACASEGGHADFAPGTPLQVDLVRYLQTRFGHVSCERVCSGSGIPNIYAFLKESGRHREPSWLAEALAQARDRTPVIVDSAFSDDRACEICVATLNTFVSILAAEAGNLALTVLATGGVYLGGGIPPRIIPALEQEHFVEQFTGKGRMSDLVAQMPVHVLTNPKTALLGAATVGLGM